MKSKHAIVIDNQGYKVDLFLVDFIEENGQVLEKPQYYTLKDGESLVYEDISTALSMIRPRWNGSTWEETATEEEIAAAQPEPTKPQPTETELFAVELSLAIAEIQTQMDMAIAELSIAIAER